MMTIFEREVLVSVLKMTESGNANIENISREAHMSILTVQKILRKHVEDGTIKIDGESIIVDDEQLLKVAIKALELEADVEKVSRFLTWQEFENISILAFEANDFSIKKHFRFSWSGRRWEIDILGLKEPIVVSVDCKHWHHGWRGSASTKSVEEQIVRTMALVESMPKFLEKIGIKGWKEAYFTPVILSLYPSAFKFYKGVPIVPVLQLRDFVQEMPAYFDEIMHFRKKISY